MRWKEADRWFGGRGNAFRRCVLKSMRFPNGTRKRCICWQFRNSPMEEFFYEFGNPSLKFHGLIEIDDEYSQYMSVVVKNFDEAVEICEVVKEYSDKEFDEPSSTPRKAELLERGRILIEKFVGRDENHES